MLLSVLAVLCIECHCISDCHICFSLVHRAMFVSSVNCLRLSKMKTDCVLCVRHTVSYQLSSAPVDNVS